MAASANGNAANGNGNSNGGVSGKEKCNGVCTMDNSGGGPLQNALTHNPGLSLDWTQEEQSTLEDLLVKYESEPIMFRYAKVAQALKDKTVRDVALRCRWMNRKENGKRRKDENNSSRKNKDKKEKATDSLPKSSQAANCSSGPPCIQSTMPMDSNEGISYTAIDGAAGQLLEQSAQALDQISANFSECKIHENINLLCQARTNIMSILNDFRDVPEVMKQMPPLPVKLNEELANSILPRTSPSSQKS